MVGNGVDRTSSCWSSAPAALWRCAARGQCCTRGAPPGAPPPPSRGGRRWTSGGWPGQSVSLALPQPSPRKVVACCCVLSPVPQTRIFWNSPVTSFPPCAVAPMARCANTRARCLLWSSARALAHCGRALADLWREAVPGGSPPTLQTVELAAADEAVDGAAEREARPAGPLAGVPAGLLIRVQCKEGMWGRGWGVSPYPPPPTCWARGGVQPPTCPLIEPCY